MRAQAIHWIHLEAAWTSQYSFVGMHGQMLQTPPAQGTHNGLKHRVHSLQGIAAHKSVTQVDLLQSTQANKFQHLAEQSGCCICRLPDTTAQLHKEMLNRQLELVQSYVTDLIPFAYKVSSFTCAQHRLCWLQQTQHDFTFGFYKVQGAQRTHNWLQQKQSVMPCDRVRHQLRA